MVFARLARKLRLLFLMRPEDRLQRAQAELRRMREDITTLEAMLRPHRDSFHHASAASTGHVQQLLARRVELEARIEKLTLAGTDGDGQ